MNKINKALPPLEAHLDAILESYLLIEISGDLKAKKVTEFARKKRALYRSAIVSLCAAWETFLEVAIETSVQFIINNATSSKQIPPNILLRISKKLIEMKDEREIWKISDDGWKSELRNNYVLLNEKFNTPKQAQVDEFIYQTIGLKNTSSNWRWQKQSSKACCKKLDEFMNFRGDIAHRIFTEKNIHWHNLDYYVNFLHRISTISSNLIRQHTFNIVGKYPWEVVEEDMIFK